MKGTSIYKDDPVLRSTIIGPLAIGQSLTKRPALVIPFAHPRKLLGIGIYCEAITAAVTFDALWMGQNEIITAATLAIHSTPEQYAGGAMRARVSGLFVEKAAATAQTFTAAHVITASKHGIVMVQLGTGGTYTTKVPAATQAYDSAALALAAGLALSPDADKVFVGYILIANNTGDWTANTDDLTDGSDVTTATFVNLAATAVTALGGAITPVALKRVAGTLSTTLNAIRTQAAKDLVVIYTSDGSAVLTRATIDIATRIYPAQGEVQTTRT